MTDTPSTSSHLAVLLEPVLEALLPAERIIDGTLGAGGHSGALLAKGANEVLGLDADKSALRLAQANLEEWGDRVHFEHTSYKDMREVARRIGWEQVDGILLDLGVSSMQLDQPERGFAFRFDGPLDMRFDADGLLPTAAEIINTWDEDELADIFFQYGEERRSRQLETLIAQRNRLEQANEQLRAEIARDRKSVV